MFKRVTIIVLAIFIAFIVSACDGRTGCNNGKAVCDLTKPLISGIRHITYVIDMSDTPDFNEGVTVFDNVDGNITAKLTVDSSAVDLGVPGSYNVTYSVSDISGNETTASITVTVVDLTAPTMSGIVGMTYVVGDPVPDYLAGITGSDNVDGDITSNIVVDSSAVDLMVEGLYEVTYLVEDSSGNSSPVHYAYLQVVSFGEDADKVPPVIAGHMNMNYTINIDVAPDFLAGVTAFDNIDGDVTENIMVDSSSVDLSTPGTYIVTYSVLDSFLNEGTAQIIVTVQHETEPPVISGVRILEVYQDDVPNYLLGLTVSDNVSALTVDDIVVDSTDVDLTTPGRYAVIFTLTDEAGNTVVEETEIIVALRITGGIDVDATYKLSTSGTDNLNPYSETLDAASDLYEWVTDSLYAGDYDWAAARDILVADGVTGLDPEIGFEEWYAGGYHAEDLPFNLFPQMAASLPFDVNGDGLVWEIALRNDLEFEDGTVIDSSVFEYSWSMLLDPDLAYINATYLFDEDYLPIVNAEAYVNQLSYRTDSNGYNVYDVDGTEFDTDNAYFGMTTGGYPVHHVESKFMNLVGPNSEIAYVEDWEDTSYGLNGWVLETINDEYFMVGSDGLMYAPEAGWTLDGTVVPHEYPQFVTSAGYMGAHPAYMDTGGNRTPVDADNVPNSASAMQLTQSPVLWSEVGFTATGPYTFQIELASTKTQWDVMNNLTSGITGVVHEAAFEAGMNAGGTSTNYGTIDNPLVSYGPFNMIAWESDVLYFYTLNEDHYSAGDFRIKKLRYDVIEDYSLVIYEFKVGRLDVADVSGEYYDEFKYSLNLKLSPLSTFFRFAFNIEGSDNYDINPILIHKEFRQAMYFALDRETFTRDLRDPSIPTFGFLGPVYYSTEYNPFSYRTSVAGIDALAAWSPSTFGYDPVHAKTLFDIAYAKAVAAGDIQDGDIVTLEYKFYDVEGISWYIPMWLEDTVEAIFNDGEATPKFDLVLAGVSGAALEDAWDNGDYEMTFGGWQGLDDDAPSMLGQVYNSSSSYMLEFGFDTAGTQVTATLPNTKVALSGWTVAFETEFAEFLPLYDSYMLIENPTALETLTYEAAIGLVDVPSDSALGEYQDWKAVLSLFIGDDLECTYDDLFNYAYGEFYNAADVNYAGKDDDFDEITATLETVLLDQMIAIPIFSSVECTVYSTRVIFEADSYHARMGWGGLKYMIIPIQTIY